MIASLVLVGERGCFDFPLSFALRSGKGLPVVDLPGRCQDSARGCKDLRFAGASQVCERNMVKVWGHLCLAYVSPVAIRGLQVQRRLLAVA
ncbi:hypothetical protein HAX54_014139 [Datura stramonium]|uniref:Uncharacterized protein n=1 Tax=Datura stramonium TaxID=4076 RepID=A0ABS8TMP0_DATST|nr:hypothetical protein [Datura stramonium]